MNKKYSIEVPLYATSIKHARELRDRYNIDIILYGGVPDSPLNGGRVNYLLDGLILFDRFSLGVSKSQLSKVTSKFYKTIETANQNGISCRIAFTNMLVSEYELTQENLSPVGRLVELSQAYGVKNGIIINNKLLEDSIRHKYGSRLEYVSSCTKYVSPHKILTPSETLTMYLEDDGKYDYICVTPQDSRRKTLLKELAQKSKSGIIALSNSYCGGACNTYHHYKFCSSENKKSLVTLCSIHSIARCCAFTLFRSFQCSAIFPFGRKNVEETASMQLNAGIVNFKLGRGTAASTLDRLVSLIAKTCQ